MSPQVPFPVTPVCSTVGKMLSKWHSRLQQEIEDATKAYASGRTTATTQRLTKAIARANHEGCLMQARKTKAAQQYLTEVQRGNMATSPLEGMFHNKVDVERFKRDREIGINDPKAPGFMDKCAAAGSCQNTED